MTSVLISNPTHTTCTCYCPSCEMFVGVNPKGQCDNCWNDICFLQNENRNFEIIKQELVK